MPTLAEQIAAKEKELDELRKAADVSGAASEPEPRLPASVAAKLAAYSGEPSRPTATEGSSILWTLVPYAGVGLALAAAVAYPIKSGEFEIFVNKGPEGSVRDWDLITFLLYFCADPFGQVVLIATGAVGVFLMIAAIPD